MANNNIEKQLDKAELMIATQNFDKAIFIYSQIIDNNIDCDEAYIFRAELYCKLGYVDKAFHDVFKAIAIDPNYDVAHQVLASIYEKQGDQERVIGALKQAIKLNDNNEEAISQLAKAHEVMADKQLSFHQADKAVVNYQLAIEIAPQNFHLLYKKAFAVYRSGDFERAQSLAEQILAKNSNHVPTRSLLVSIFEKAGESKKGWAIIESLVEDYPNNAFINITFAKYALRNKNQSVAIKKIQQVLLQPELASEDRLSLHMLLGKLFDSIADYQSAYDHFSQANKLKFNDYDVSLFEQQISLTINYFSSKRYNDLAVSGNPSDECIFILGMPRSGTSLIEQIVSAHSKVYGGGELHNVVNLIDSIQNNDEKYPQVLNNLSVDELDNYAKELLVSMKTLSPSSQKITDKLPHNFLNIGLIHKLLPKAKIINCLRNPIDNCLSCYFQHFGGYHPYAYDLSNLAEYYQQYQRLMCHWEKTLKIPMLNIQYEDVVNDTKTQVENILNYLNLDWEDECLEFYKNKRTVNTASYTQVDKKIYKKAMNRWENYKPYISELTDVFGGD